MQQRDMHAEVSSLAAKARRCDTYTSWALWPEAVAAADSVDSVSDSGGDSAAQALDTAAPALLGWAPKLTSAAVVRRAALAADAAAPTHLIWAPDLPCEAIVPLLAPKRRLDRF